MSTDLVGKLRRGLRKPPRVIARRLAQEAQRSLDRLLLPALARRESLPALLTAAAASSLDDLWNRLATSPVWAAPWADPQALDQLCPGETARVLQRAELALARRVDLLGSGPLDLGPAIDWQRDYKTGLTWPRAFAHSIDYNNPDRPSDVKFPWELSRLQWLLPLGQAWWLTRQERFAQAARDVLTSWLDDNPCLGTVNWSCTMEIALRIFSWSWLLRACHGSQAWADPAFRARLLQALYWHGKLTHRYLEFSDVNGNHCTADAAGMVLAGLLFAPGREPRTWAERGWQLLSAELPRQVFPDGVDFEASVPYHRLVLELFFLAALFRLRCGQDVPAAYRDRLAAMARFARAYTRPDGTTPLWGDADDARALPLGAQPLADHRYLAPLVGLTWNLPELADPCPAALSETHWLLGAAAARRLLDHPPPPPPRSTSFPAGGCFVMRNDQDHVFIDCGPVGMAGRGGHGHNDCLSFEAALGGVHLVSDCGAYVYTASYAERNRFRCTASHNTPQVVGHEINRLVSPDNLWNLHDDARPELRRWTVSAERDLLIGAHTGYQRLQPPLRPVRTVLLDHRRHALLVRDQFEVDPRSCWQLAVPLHLALGVTVGPLEPGCCLLQAGGREFLLAWDGPTWSLAVEPARISPSYGVAHPAWRLVWRLDGPAAALAVALAPADLPGCDLAAWRRQTLAEVDA